MLSAFALTLLFPGVLEFAADVVYVLAVDALLDLAPCKLGDVAKCAAVTEGLDKTGVVEVVAIVRTLGIVFVLGGAFPHLLDTQPPTLPIRLRLPTV